MLKIQIIYQKIQKNKTNSIQNNIPEAGRRLWWYGRTLQSVMDYITTGDIPRLRYPQFEPRAPPDDNDDSSDDDGGNLEGDDYQYNDSMTKSLQISCIISGISNHSKMDTKHITGNIIHMIHSTKFGTINYYTSFLPLCPCLLTIVPYPWSILII